MSPFLTGEQIAFRPKSRRDFKVAIICVSPDETKAVQALLDRTFDESWMFYDKVQNDSNVYINGLMGTTNVVICQCPGAGQFWSAGVVVHLHMTYTKLKLVIAVGVCGGLPSGSKRPQRLLGDVIISQNMIEYSQDSRHPDKFKRTSLPQVYDHALNGIQGGRKDRQRIVRHGL